MKKINLANCPKYKQDLGNNRVRIVTIVQYNKKKITAACKEFDKDTEANSVFYHYTFIPTLKRETTEQLIQMAKDYYKVKEEQKIN